MAIRNSLILLTLGVALAAAAPAYTVRDLPVPRAGLWEETRTENGVSSTAQVCRDGKPVRPSMGEGCAPSTISRAADGTWALEGHCAFPGGPATWARVTMAGDVDHAITGGLETHTQRPGAPDEVTRMTVVGRYLGVCPETQ